MRYALFAGGHYYPAGGWEDFHSIHYSIVEAQAAVSPTQHDWAQIVDLDDREVVANCYDVKRDPNKWVWE